MQLSSQGRTLAQSLRIAARKAGWDEAQHPRDEHGRFGEGSYALKSEHHSALNDYVNADESQPGSYQAVNAVVSGEYTGEFAGPSLEKAAHLSAAIASKPLAHDQTFYRGTEVPANLKAGDVIVPHGFTSVTTEPSVALDFARYSQKSAKAAVLIIKAKAGDQVIDVSRSGVHYTKDEHEHIFDHTVSFKVLSDDGHNGDGHRLLTVEPIKPAAVKKAAAWDESLHPRDEHGRFGTTSSGKEVHFGASSYLDERYKDFTVQDHQEASTMYYKLAQAHRQNNDFNAPESKGFQKADAHAWSHDSKAKQMKDKADTEREEAEAKDTSNQFGKEVTNREQAKALKGYVNASGGPTGYHAVNAKAAGTYKADDPQFHAEAQASVDHLSAAIDRSKLTEDKMLYRGTVVPKDIKVGDVIAQHGFTSASSDKRIADHFARNAKQYQRDQESFGRPPSDNHPAILNIHAKAGQSVLDVVAARGGDDLKPEALSHHNNGQGRGEKEHLFAHQTTFRVTADHGVSAKGYRMLHVEPIENAGSKS